MPYKDPEKRKIHDAIYYKANAEKKRTYDAIYRKANAEKKRTYDAIYYKANAEKVRVKSLAWCKANPEKLKLEQARQNNPGLPKELLAVIVMKNMIAKEIRNQTNQTT